MIEKVTCQFCASRCGMLLNLEDGKPAKLLRAPCENACPAGIDILLENFQNMFLMINIYLTGSVLRLIINRFH